MTFKNPLKFDLDLMFESDMVIFLNPISHEIALIKTRNLYDIVEEDNVIYFKRKETK